MKNIGIDGPFGLIMKYDDDLPITRPGKRLQFANWKITIFNR